MVYWNLSNIANIGAICGYMGMFGLWRSPTKMAPMFSIENIVVCRLGRPLHAMVAIG